MEATGHVGSRRCPYCGESIGRGVRRCPYCAEPLLDAVDDSFAYSPTVREGRSPLARFLGTPRIAWGSFALAAAACLVLAVNVVSLAERSGGLSRELASYRQRYAEEARRSSRLQEEVDSLGIEVAALEAGMASCRDVIEDHRLGIAAVGRMLDSVSAGSYILASYHAGRADRLFDRADAAAVGCVAGGRVV